MTYLNEISSNVDFVKAFAVVGVMTTFIAFIAIRLVVEQKIQQAKLKIKK